MDIGEIVSDSIRYPSSNWTKVIILGILFIISFLIIPVFLALGYIFKVLKASLAGLEELPEFDEWIDMLVDGIKVFVVYIVYFLPAILIMIFSVISIWYSIMSFAAMQTVGTMMSPELLFGMFGGTALAGIIISMIYMLVITPIMAIAIANMAYNDGEINAAFRFSEIFELISQIGWVDLIIWYIVLILIGVVIGVLTGILGIIPVIGWIISILVIYPYINIFYARSVAWLYASAFENSE